MGIERIKVKNFTVFKGEHQVILGNRMIFCRGINGAGKTTLFVDVPAFALYGPDAISHRGKKTDLISQGMREAHVELVFTYKSPQGQSSIYTVRRSVNKEGGSSAELTEIVNGREMRKADKVNDVNTKVTELLGIDQKTFYSTVVIRQGEVETLSEASPSERRDLFLKIFNINFEPLRKKIGEEKQRLKSDYDKFETKLNDIKKELETEIDLKARLSQLSIEKELKEKELKELEIRYEQLEQKEKALLSELGTLEELTRQINEKRQKIKNLESEMSEIEKHINDIKEKINKFTNADEKIKIIRSELEYLEKFKDLIKERQNIEKLLNQLMEERDRIRKNVGRIDEIKKQLDNIMKIEKDLYEMEREYENLKNEKEMIIKELSENTTKLNEAEKHKEILSKTKNADKIVHCPVCGAELSVQKRDELIKKYDEEINGYKYYIEYLEEELNKREKELKDLDSKIKTLRSSVGSKKELEKRLSELNEEKEYLEGLEYEILQKQESLKQIENEIGFIKSEVPETLRTINIQVIEKQIEARKKELNMLENESIERAKLEIELKNLLEKNEEKRRELDTLHKDLTNLKEKTENLEKIKQEHEMLKKALVDVKKLRDQIYGRINEIGGIINEINIKLKELVQKREELQELEKKINEYKRELRIYEELDKIFMERNLPAKIISYYVKRVEYYAQEYVNLFLSDRFVLKLNVDDGGISAIVQEGVTQRKLEALSMGERTAIGFALRLGIMSAVAEQHGLRRPDFLIIDEGLSSLDEERRNAFLDILAKLKTNFSTIIVISHIGELADSPIFDTVITIERDGSQSRIKVESNE